MASECDMDILVLGAGISGVFAGYYFQKELPNKSYAIFDARERFGGTWDLYRYPGIRSDSDMFTLGFPFHPWPHAEAIGQGDKIRTYIEDTAKKFGIDKHTHFGHRCTSLAWSSKEQRWTATFERASDKSVVTKTARIIHSCMGYYNHEKPFMPEIKGSNAFKGQWLCPQLWPKDEVAMKDKHVVVIGSGATTVSMVPALVKQGAAKVSMVQRSPSYFHSVAQREWWTDLLRAVLPTFFAMSIIGFISTIQYMSFFFWCRAMPGLARRVLRLRTAKQLPPNVPLDPHFNPRYYPWEQRLCFTPDGEFYDALKTGRLDMVTGDIETCEPDGVRMADGALIKADIIVQATGLNIRFMGRVPTTVDGTPIEIGDRLVYRGIMLQGVPNFTSCMGYIYLSWSVGATLTTEYVCMLFKEMDKRQKLVATPTPSPSVKEVPLDVGMSSGFIQRAVKDKLFPKTGDQRPWVPLFEPLSDRWYLRTKSVLHDIKLE